MTPKPYRQFPEVDRFIGDYTKGEIELFSGEQNSVPVPVENKYVALVEDRVRFPDGSEGCYTRIFHQSELMGQHGTVMLARQGDQDVFLRIFRHPTRSWELECLRGFAELGLTAQESARTSV